MTTNTYLPSFTAGRDAHAKGKPRQPPAGANRRAWFDGWGYEAAEAATRDEIQESR